MPINRYVRKEAKTGWFRWFRAFLEVLRPEAATLRVSGALLAPAPCACTRALRFAPAPCALHPRPALCTRALRLHPRE
jgi:hypothetical protein